MTDCIIKALAEPFRQDMLQMIAQAFVKDDPLARSQGIKESDFHDFIDRLYDDFEVGGLSRVAIDTSSKRIAAVVLAKAHRFEPSEEGSDAIAAIITAARNLYFSGYAPAAGELMHIHFVASAVDYRRRRWVHPLIADCLEAGKGRGYQNAVVETSGIRSRNLFEQHFDFRARVNIEYTSFEWRGSFPFRSIADHGGLTLMSRRLD